MARGRASYDPRAQLHRRNAQRPKRKFRSDIMRKLVFDNSAEAQEHFKVLWLAHINGPPAADRDQMYRINKVTKLFKESSSERHEMQDMGRGRMEQVSVRVLPDEGLTVMLEDAEYSDLEAALDGFIKRAPRAWGDSLEAAERFLKAAETVKVEAPKKPKAVK